MIQVVKFNLNPYFSQFIALHNARNTRRFRAQRKIDPRDCACYEPTPRKLSMTLAIPLPGTETDKS